VSPSDAVAAGDWIGPRLHPFGQGDVASVVPTGFDKYARLPAATRDGLVPLLARHTTTPDQCWFCLWEGYGYLHPGGTSPLWRTGSRPRHRVGLPWWRRVSIRQPTTGKSGGPRVQLPNRAYLLFTGLVAQGSGWQDGPNLWWPEDRAWCVASEIDLDETLVGGTQALIEAILAKRDLSASTTTVEALLRSGDAAVDDQT
jgi:hypothetical protein